MTIEVGSKLHAQLEEIRKLAAENKEIPKIMVMGDSPEIEAIKAFFIKHDLQNVADALCVVSRDEAEVQMYKSIPMPPPFPSDLVIRDYAEYYPRGAKSGRHYHEKPNIKEVDPQAEQKAAAIREDNKRRKELNFRKRLPKGHPDRIES